MLSAVEETLASQQTEATPTAYFAALLALLRQSLSADGTANKDLATSVVYLLDVITPYTPEPLLRSEFTQILTTLAPALTIPNADAPLLRPAIGCLENLLLAQDAAAWKLSVTQISPRRAVAGLLTLAVDPRPKVRKRALDALTKILENPPPSPSLDHPAADMAAETALQELAQLARDASAAKRNKRSTSDDNAPTKIHALRLVKTIASAAGGWPSKKIESLCEVLLGISKSSNEFMTMASFEVFEVIFQGMAGDVASSKLPRLLEVISELRPSHNDTQLLPPWIAILSRAYDVAAQVEPEETFQKLPELIDSISTSMASSSHNIRISTSECLISFMSNCIPNSALLEPSVYDEKIFAKIGKAAMELLSVKYQAAWMESFAVIGAIFDGLRWQAVSTMDEVLKTIGDLRAHDTFAGKREADEVIGKAVRAIGPQQVLAILPLNLAKPKAGQPGRAWMLPILRDFVSNTDLAHFRTEMVPLSELMFSKVIQHGDAEKTMDIKIYETLVQQIWSTLPGYCDLPLDLISTFTQEFAEILAEVLYKQADMRIHVCKALQTLVDSNKAVAQLGTEDDLVVQNRISQLQAKANLEHLGGFASNMLAVLFNVYSQTLPQFRGYILQCINEFLSITSEPALMQSFERVAAALESSLADSAENEAEKQRQKQNGPSNRMPPMSHTLMDLIITMSIYLPRDSLKSLFVMASNIVTKDDDSQLQKKAYKLIPRLAESEIGKAALQEQNHELQMLFLNSAEKVSAPARRDRLAAISTLVPYIPSDALHFLPAILSEVVMSCKEVNERTRATAFDLLVLMGEKIQGASGSLIQNSKVAHMPDDAPDVTANLEEYFTMVSAGLAGSTPHMVSASVTALTRILYHFREALSSETLTDLVQTMDLFLTSNNREIVQSVLGFVKVCVLSLPMTLMQPRLQTLIPNLMVWSHEHKAHFKIKVKHILERMVKRFGVDIVNKYCPEEDRKLIANIRKTKERTKRQKDEAKASGGQDGDESAPKRKGRFESEYDEAMYGSDDSSQASDESGDDFMDRKSKGARKGGSTYIIEDEDEPLDLLDRKALANISTTKPSKQRVPTRTKAKVNLDGKLVLGGPSDDEDNAMVIDTPADGTSTEAGGVGAYVDALKSRDAVQRGRGGKLKFSNKRNKEDREDMDDEVIEAVKSKLAAGARSPRANNPRGRGGISAGRRGLGEGRRSQHDAGSGGRVMKSPRGRGRRR